MLNDTISDMFTRIRNAIKENHENVEMPHSNVKTRICQIIKDAGYIYDFEIISLSLVKKIIKIKLKYKKNGESIISKLQRVSKPSKRIYKKKANIPKPLNGYGISIISTSKGILSGKQARINNVGGELIGIIW